jgi:hypothetical protein
LILEIIAQLLSNIIWHLLKKGIGYQGLIYRKRLGIWITFRSQLLIKISFAGFNALNASEEKIIQHLIAADQAKYTGIPTKPF